jgi:hypothetical protein
MRGADDGGAGWCRQWPAVCPVASIPACPTPPISATSLAEDGAGKHLALVAGPVPGRPCHIAQLTSARPGHWPGSRIHPFLPVRLVAGHLASNLAHWGALGTGSQRPPMPFR